MTDFLNNARALWWSVLSIQVLLIILFTVFYFLGLGNEVFFFIPSWFGMAFTAEFAYLLHRNISAPEAQHIFSASWLLWVLVLIVSVGIALFFFTAAWFAGFYTMIPAAATYLGYSYDKAFA